MALSPSALLCFYTECFISHAWRREYPFMQPPSFPQAPPLCQALAGAVRMKCKASVLCWAPELEWACTQRSAASFSLPRSLPSTQRSMKDGVAVRERGPEPDSGNRVVVWAQRLYPRASQAEGGRRRDAREVVLPRGGTRGSRRPGWRGSGPRPASEREPGRPYTCQARLLSILAEDS